MGWLDERMAQSKALRECEKNIWDNAPGLFNAIWDSIVALVEDAKKRGFVLVTNGGPYDRVVRLPQTPGEPLELRITLSSSRTKITVLAPNMSMDLPIDLCADGVACVKLDGLEASLEDVAIRALDPLLFPELPRWP